jgi:hypothetical protein
MWAAGGYVAKAELVNNVPLRPIFDSHRPLPIGRWNDPLKLAGTNSARPS